MTQVISIELRFPADVPLRKITKLVADLKSLRHKHIHIDYLKDNQVVVDSEESTELGHEILRDIVIALGGGTGGLVLTRNLKAIYKFIKKTIQNSDIIEVTLKDPEIKFKGHFRDFEKILTLLLTRKNGNKE